MSFLEGPKCLLLGAEVSFPKRAEVSNRGRSGRGRSGRGQSVQNSNIQSSVVSQVKSRFGQVLLVSLYETTTRGCKMHYKGLDSN